MIRLFIPLFKNLKDITVKIDDKKILYVLLLLLSRPRLPTFASKWLSFILIYASSSISTINMMILNKLSIESILVAKNSKFYTKLARIVYLQVKYLKIKM